MSTIGLIFHKYVRKAERKEERQITKIVGTIAEENVPATYIHLGLVHYTEHLTNSFHHSTTSRRASAREQMEQLQCGGEP